MQMRPRILYTKTTDNTLRDIERERETEKERIEKKKPQILNKHYTATRYLHTEIRTEPVTPSNLYTHIPPIGVLSLEKRL